MGCTPSHGGIINSVAKSGVQFFKKPRAVLPGSAGAGERGAIPALDGSSACYDSGGALPQGQRPTEVRPGPPWAQTSAEGHCPLPRDPAAGNKGHPGGLIPDTKASPSQLNTPQSPMARDIPFKARSSLESQGEETGGESATQGPSLWEESPTQGPGGKVDFPEPLAKAHRLAYAYLHSCLSKYEAILGLAHQATQARELLQPVATFLLLCFEEASRLLGELSRDGEALLGDVGGDLAWPRGEGGPPEQPDLLQQLLQYTVSQLRALGAAAASLSGGCLEGSGSHFQAAARRLGSQLSEQRAAEERLLRTLGRLESLAGGRSDPGGQGLPLCSEDSGIGADSEPAPPPDRLGEQASWDFPPEPAEREPGVPPTAEAGLVGPTWQQSPVWRGSDPPQDCLLSGPPGARVQPAAQRAAGSRGPSGSGPEGAPCGPGGLGKGDSCDSVGAGVSVGAPLPKGSRSAHTPSLGAGADSNPEEREDPRPRSSPAGPESLFQPHPGRLRSPHAREMVLRMKEAISDRIKFVPVSSGHPDWAEEEEEEETAVPPRRSTAPGGRSGPRGQRRCGSEACLQGHAEELTLQELRGVQGDLSRRLEAFYAARGTQGWGQSRGQALVPRAASLRPHRHGGAAPSGTIGKLKASLTQSFGILPSLGKGIPQTRGPRPEGARPWLPDAIPPGERAGEAAGARDRAGGGQPPRTSVKKLIETFSPTESPQTPGPCLRKWGVPIMPPRFPIDRGLAPLSPKPHVSPTAGPGRGPCAPLLPPLPAAPTHGRGDLPWDAEDPEHLPPPPLEVLMDRSFVSLGPPERSRLAGSSPEGTHGPGPGEAGSAPTTRASPKRGASMSPADLLPSRLAATPTGPCSPGPGAPNPGKPAGDLHLPPAISRDPGAEVGGARGQARVDGASSLSKHPRGAGPWHRPGPPGPARGPRSSEAPRQSPERSSPPGRKASPPRAHGPPRADRRHPSPSSSPRPAQPSAPSVRGSPGPTVSPPASPRARSPPTATPPRHELPGPPPESPPAQHKISDPPASGGPSPPPPESPRRGHQGTRGSEGSGAATARASGSTCPRCCPASSLLEATSSFAAAHPLTPALPPRGGPQRGATLGALHPQPFVRRTASDRQPGARLRLPAPGAAGSACEPRRGQSSSGSEESPKKDSEPWSGPGAPEPKGGSAASPPELCVLGHGLQREASAGRTQDKPQRKEVA